MIKRLAVLLSLCLALPAWGQLVLSDFVVPTGHTTVFAALIQSSGSGDAVFDTRTSQAQLLDGGLVIGPDITAARMRWYSNRVVLNRTGTGGFSDYFHMGGIHREGRWHVQNASEVAAVAANGVADDDYGGGFVNFRNEAFRDLVDDFRNFDQLFIFALTKPDSAPSLTCSAFGSTTLQLDSIRIGAVQPLRAYHGAVLICGNAP